MIIYIQGDLLCKYACGLKKNWKKVGKENFNSFNLEGVPLLLDLEGIKETLIFQLRKIGFLNWGNFPKGLKF